MGELHGGSCAGHRARRFVIPLTSSLNLHAVSRTGRCGRHGALASPPAQTEQARHGGRSDAHQRVRLPAAFRAQPRPRGGRRPRWGEHVCSFHAAAPPGLLPAESSPWGSRPTSRTHAQPPPNHRKVRPPEFGGRTRSGSPSTAAPTDAGQPDRRRTVPDRRGTRVLSTAASTRIRDALTSRRKIVAAVA